MTRASVTVAVDAGTAMIKIACGGTSRRPAVISTPQGDQRAVLCAALAAASWSGQAGRLYLAVPDTWLDGTVAGARAAEALREAGEDAVSAEQISCVGQLAAVSAEAAGRLGSGRYLVCDIGGAGVRVAAFDVTDQAISTLAAYSAAGDGWHDFNASVWSLPPAGRDRLPADWYLSAAAQDPRATAVLRQALASPDYTQARAYSFGNRCDLTAGEMIDCFAPTRERIREGVARASAAVPLPLTHTVLTGGLGWFPLASLAVADATGIVPVVMKPEAAACGALLFARGKARMNSRLDRPPVSVPVHRIKDGLLEPAGLPLSWTEPFTGLPEGPLTLEAPELVLEIASRQVTAQLPGLVPGPYRIGLRPGWSQAGVLVLRPADADGGSPAHVVSIADLNQPPGADR